MHVDFTTLSFSAVQNEAAAIARDAEAAFGHLSATQLNWQAAPNRWSVAQCLDHLIRINAVMVEGIGRALAPGAPAALLQRLPGVPRMLGRIMIRSLSPQATRRLPAPSSTRPTASDLGADIVQRFVAAQADLCERLRSFERPDLDRIIMVSPFSSFVAYSVLDACRLIVAHERRHLEQARRVTEAPGFPTAPVSDSTAADR